MLPDLPSPDARRSEVAASLVSDLWSTFDANLADAYDPNDTLGLYDEDGNLDPVRYGALLVDFVSQVADADVLYTATRLARVRAARAVLAHHFDQYSEEDEANVDVDEWIEENLGYLDVEELTKHRDQLDEVDAAWLTVFEDGAL